MTTSMLALLLAVAPAAEPEKPAKGPVITRVALYRIDADGVEPRQTRIYTDSLAQELRKLQRVDVITRAEIQAMLDLEAEKQALGCGDESCLAEIADALGVDEMIIGSVADVGEERVIALRRLDQRSAEARGSVQYRFVPRGGEGMLATVGKSVEELYPDVPLKAGQTRGVDARMALTLNPPPIAPWMTWSVIGVGASALAAAGGLALGAFAEEAESQRLLAASSSTAQPALAVTSHHERANALLLSAQATAITGVVILAGAGVMALFTDFAGWGDQ